MAHGQRRIVGEPRGISRWIRLRECRATVACERASGASTSCSKEVTDGTSSAIHGRTRMSMAKFEPQAPWLQLLLGLRDSFDSASAKPVSGLQPTCRSPPLLQLSPGPGSGSGAGANCGAACLSLRVTFRRLGGVEGRGGARRGTGRWVVSGSAASSSPSEVWSSPSRLSISNQDSNCSCTIMYWLSYYGLVGFTHAF